MEDFQRLLDATFSFVEELLTKNGEFYPIGTAIKEDQEIEQMIIHDGDEFPLSEVVIKNLKEAAIKDKGRYRAVAIFYAVMVTDQETNKKTDAVAVHVESKYKDEGFVFYYPYTLIRGEQLEFSSSWKKKIAKEIFPT